MAIQTTHAPPKFEVIVMCVADIDGSMTARVSDALRKNKAQKELRIATLLDEGYEQRLEKVHSFGSRVILVMAFYKPGF